MGRILGVLYATGPEGEVPTERAVRALDAIARIAALHIGIVRAFDGPPAPTEGDALTGLPDHRGAVDTLRRRLAKERPFGVALCDVDHFRLYNSRHSTTVGDAALRLLTEVLLKAVRPQDYVARVDGQQFLLVVNDGTAADAVRVVERVRETLVVTQAVRPEPAFTVSFGIADSRQARTPEGLLQFAGDALEMAKRDGRNRVVVAEPPIHGVDFPNL
jgi:diguanylate cyclase